MSNKIFKREEILKELENTPIDKSGITIEYLLIVLNKDINNTKYNSASSYIADKINQYTQKIFEKLSGVKLNKNIEGSLIIIDNYTGAINTQYYKIKPKDLDEAIKLFNSMNTSGTVYYYFRKTTSLQKAEANYIKIDNKRTFIREGIYIIDPIIDIRVLNSDMSIGAKLLYDKYIKAA